MESPCDEFIKNFMLTSKNVHFCTHGNKLVKFNFKFIQGNVTLTLRKASYIWQLLTVKTTYDTFVLMITTEEYDGHLGEVWKFSETSPVWNLSVSIKTTARIYTGVYFSNYQGSSKSSIFY